MSNVTAVVLAGGIGKRFVPFLHDKTLFPFMGQSLIERTLSMVAQAGIQNVIVATNRHNHEWLEHDITAKFPHLHFQLLLQPEPNGMGGAMLAVKELLPERDIVVMNAGDMVEPHLLPELLQQSEQYDALLTGLETPEYQPVGYFVLDGDRVVGIKEKPGAENMPSNLGNLVFHYFSDPHDFVRRIEHAQLASGPEADDVYEQALNSLMTEKNVGVYRYIGRWQKLKFGFHVLDMVEYLLQDLKRSLHPTASIAETAQINGPVTIGANAKILDGAVIQGPCYIGEGVIVGNGTLVRQSIIEAGTTVGFGSEVVRSYVGAGCDLHHAYVGDSVLEAKVHFGYGAHTANYRFDHCPVELKTTRGKFESPKRKLGALIAQCTELGVNVTTLPGVSIGAQSLIYPGVVVHEPVPDKHILKQVQPQELVPRQAL